jgi:branched-chain amino acid transport system permease protein
LELLVAQLINGLQYGFLLMLLSLGLNMAFGLARVVNFAHGEFFTLGAFIAFASLSRMPFWLTLMVAPLAVALIGAALEWALIRRIRSRPEIDTLLLTFGISMLLLGLVEQQWGRIPQSVPVPESLASTLDFMDFSYPSYRALVTVLCVSVAVATFALLKFTKFGLLIRATAEDAEMSDMLGVDTRRLLTWVFVFGAALAGFSGALAAPIFTAHSTMGQAVLIDAFLVIVIGGLGSLRGCVPAALAVGLTKSVAGGYIAEWSMAVLFAVVMVMLLLRPKGILGDGRIA